MFEQYLQDGGNLFIVIVAVIAGFAAAIGFIDFKKTKNSPTKN